MLHNLPRTISADDLNGEVSFDSPFRVHADGRVTTYIPAEYSPIEMITEQDGGGWLESTPLPDGWSYVDGFSGQYGYSGPVMHPSEYLGGGMADHVLSTPGLYCLIIIDDPDLTSDGSGTWTYPDGSTTGDPAVGWALLRQDTTQCAECNHNIVGNTAAVVGPSHADTCSRRTFTGAVSA